MIDCENCLLILIFHENFVDVNMMCNAAYNYRRKLFFVFAIAEIQCLQAHMGRNTETGGAWSHAQWYRPNRC